MKVSRQQSIQSKELVITEKPSVASDLAKALGGFAKRGDHYESDTHLIAAAAGHLLDSVRPKTWALEDLPLLPEEVQKKPKPRQAERLAGLVALLGRDDVGGVINACDAGREGELIFWEIMGHADCQKPVRRLWLQSMTTAAIRRAFQELRPASAVQGLADAAVCRELADWWLGINMTKALTGIMKRAGRYDLTPAGRVQTPTLMMVCERDLEIERFVPEPYWMLTGSLKLADGRVIEAGWTGRGQGGEDTGRRIGSRDRAEAIVRKTAGQPATVAAKQRVELKKPPLLFKLNDLLSEASSLFGYSAERTQSAAQSLYDKKLITYPRTESQHLRPEDDVEMVRERLEQIVAMVPVLAGPAAEALARGVDPGNTRVFDSSKVGDHFAIVPAEFPEAAPALMEAEQPSEPPAASPARPPHLPPPAAAPSQTRRSAAIPTPSPQVPTSPLRCPPPPRLRPAATPNTPDHRRMRGSSCLRGRLSCRSTSTPILIPLIGRQPDHKPRHTSLRQSPAYISQHLQSPSG
jgi:DNA topoisomerase-3